MDAEAREYPRWTGPKRAESIAKSPQARPGY